MAAGNGPAWPSELRFQKAKSELFIRFDDGHAVTIPYELLRVESPSAETKGHGGQAPPPPARKRKVGVTSADPVGRYALRIHFTDGHNTGLYTWSYLRELGDEKVQRMATYEKRLTEHGLKRD